MGATVYTAAIECEYIRLRSSVIFEKVKDICLLNFNDVSVLPDDEYYETENLEKVQIKYITEPQKLFHVNFNELQELRKFHKDGIKQLLRAKCKYNGIIDGLVTWFKLHLDEEITLDSSNGKSCWDVAVFPTIHTACYEGDVVTIKAEILKSKLKCSCSMSNMELNVTDYKSLYHLPKEVIVFLNDFDYMKLLTEIGRSHKSGSIKYILDISPFPIYGLTILKECKDSELLYYKTDNPILCSLIEKVARDNNLQGKVRTISSYDEILCHLDSIFVHNFDIKGELRDSRHEILRYNSYILYMYRYTCALFAVVYIKNMLPFFCFRCLLKPDSPLLPEKIFLMGQLVYSEDLPNMAYVQDANLQVPSCSSSYFCSDMVY